MKRNFNVPLLLTMIAMAALLSILALRSWGNEKKDQDDDTGKAASPQSNPVQQANAVHLGQNALLASGIKTVVLAETSGHAEAEALAVVLSPQEVLDLRNSYLANEVQIEKAQASLHASSLEYQRLVQLNKEDKNASDKAVEAAAAIFQSDQATLRNAQQVSDLSLMSVRQHWGPVLSNWIEHDTAELHSLLEGREVLVQVSLPPGLAAPRQLAVSDGSKTISAYLISTLPRVDLRFQTPSYLYRAAAPLNELTPGMNVTVFVATGSVAKGVRIPGEAVLWWQGKSWIYIETDPGVFLRREIAQTDVSANSWFVREGFHPGDRVVVIGAQQLLSQEFHSLTSAGDTD